MASYWSILIDEFPKDLTARHELAKHHEHRTRNLPEAERLCLEAIDALETRIALGRAFGAESSQLAHFQKRLDRLRGKLQRGGCCGDDSEPS